MGLDLALSLYIPFYIYGVGRQAQEVTHGMAEANLVEAVKYIEKREQELSRYSDKLRASVKRVFDQFGDSDYCRICNLRDMSRVHFKFMVALEYGGIDYTDDEEKIQKLLTSGKYILVNSKDFNNIWIINNKFVIVKNDDYHEFMPKIHLSLNVDGEPFYSTKSDGDIIDYYLASRDGEIKIIKASKPDVEFESLEEESEMTYHVEYNISNISRKVLKELVKSHAIEKFLRKYIENLDSTTDEIEKVSEIAEKLASVL